MAAQNPGSITGKVTDKATAEPIPYITITVKDNGTVVTGGITDDNGDFAIKNLPLKNYTVELQFMGYKTQQATANLSDTNKTVSLGNIAIAEDITQLKEVEIVKETTTIEQKIDRKVITVGRDLTTAGGTASEIMNNIPSVNVDHEGKISLRGNENVRILIDGRPTTIDPAQLLKQIPSSSIKKIELITNPSAKYNPEGMSGIINIILHKNANDGFNGNFNAGVTFGETPKFNNGLDMNYRRGKVNFFGNVGSNFGKYFNSGEVNRRDIYNKQFVDVTNDNEGVLGKIGMDYYIDDKNTLSVYTNQNYFTGEAKIGTDIFTANPADNVNQYSNLDGDNYSNAYNLAFKHKFDKDGHTLDLEANYNDSKSTQDVNYRTIVGATDQSWNDGLEDKRSNTTINLDYVNPLSEKSTLELGAEARIITTDNEFFTTNPVVLLSEPEFANVKYTYDMSIYSAYATFGQKWTKFSYQVGARLESYKVDANFNNNTLRFKDDYITVYPSLFAGYNFNEKNMMQFSFSRRVDRPSIEQTKMIREFSTYQLTSRGNAELEPQFTSSIELNYTKMFGQGSSITGGVFYRFIQDEINRIFYPNDATPDDPNDQIMSFDNFDRNYAWGFEVSANYKIAKWWDIQPAVDFSSISQKGMVSQSIIGTDDFTFITREITANAFNARLNSNFRVNDRLSLLLFGFYRGPVNGVQGSRREMYKVDSGARYSLLDNRMSLSLRFNDMFNTQRFGFDSDNPFPQSGEFRWESRTVYFGLNYRFGGGKNMAMQRKQRDDNTKQNSGGMF